MPYDPNEAPDPAWFALDPADRRAQILDAHPEDEGDALHPAAYPAGLHAGLHLAVEDQIHEGLPEVAETLARLEGEGLRRHAAIHALVDVFLPFLTQVEYSPEAHIERLRGIDAGAWLARQVGR